MNDAEWHARSGERAGRHAQAISLLEVKPWATIDPKFSNPLFATQTELVVY